MAPKRQKRAISINSSSTSSGSGYSSEEEIELSFSVHPHLENHSCLPLPEPFCRAHSHRIWEFIILQFANKDTWKVKVDRKKCCCYDKMYITRGWEMICKTYGLFNTPHIVDFEFDGINTIAGVIRVLDATTLVPSRVPYQFPAFTTTTDCFLLVSGGLDPEVVPDDGLKYFSKTLTLPYANKLYVPVGFFNQYVRDRGEVALVFEGRPGELKGSVLTRINDRGCDLAGEWATFVKAHGMQLGVTYCFKTDGNVHEGLPVLVVMEH